MECNDYSTWENTYNNIKNSAVMLFYGSYNTLEEASKSLSEKSGHITPGTVVTIPVKDPDKDNIIVANHIYVYSDGWVFLEGTEDLEEDPFNNDNEIPISNTFEVAKCECCGAPLRIYSNRRAVCDYCGSEYWR